MTFSQVISPFHSLSVWEYNYVEDAYSSLCLAAVCSVRCISHEAEETRSPVSLSFCQSPLSGCMPASQIILDQAAGDMASR